LIHELHEQGNTIILITHDDGIAAKAQRQVRIMDGKIVSDTASGRNSL
jgi:putative ABC transport system ATP-binding protein